MKEYAQLKKLNAGIRNKQKLQEILKSEIIEKNEERMNKANEKTKELRKIKEREKRNLLKKHI